MFLVLDDIERMKPISRTRWMHPSNDEAPPGRHVALAPGVLIFYPHHNGSVSVLNTMHLVPPPDVAPTQRDLRPPSWHEWSLCAGMDQEIFFSEDRRKRVPLAKDAKTICRACPVATECLTWALEHEEEFGVWAASSGRQRSFMFDRIGKGVSTIAEEVRSWLNIK